MAISLAAVPAFPLRLCVSAAVHQSDNSRASHEDFTPPHRPAASPLFLSRPPLGLCHVSKRPVTRRHVATKDAVEGDAPKDQNASGAGGGGSGEESDEDEEVATLVRGMTFAELCNDFECVSSPAVERTAKRLARDIHDMREDKRTLSCFADDSKYSDSLRFFTGRDKYRRPSWIRSALQNPSVHMVGMRMVSTSVLEIIWQLRGSLAGGQLDARVTSTFTLNQISGLVTSHRDQWNVATSALPVQLAFWASRAAWAAGEAVKDVTERGEDKGKSGGGESSFIYPDPSGDPRKFIQQGNPNRDLNQYIQQSDPNRDLYQAAFFIALVYLVVRTLQLVV